MKQIPLIYDGDMGGDDLWAITVLLAHPDKFDIKGFATCYGNASQPFATENLLNHLHWLGYDGQFDVAQGADFPCDGMRPFGDDAYGKDGVGGLIFEKSPQEASQGDIADWYAGKLDEAKEPVTIFCTGPATNVALLIEKYPEKINKIKDFIFMGGGINPPGKDGKPSYNDADGNPTDTQRTGNITHFAEFNAFQDPKALNIILNSGVKVIFLSTDATQHIVYNPARQQEMQTMDDTYGPAFHRMMIVVEEKDRPKYGVDGCFAHDSVAAVYLIKSALFTSREITGLYFDESSPDEDTTRRGQTLLRNEFKTKAQWVDGVTDENAVYEVVSSSIRVTVSQAAGNPKPPAI